VACLYLALILALPLPLVNLVPALCLAALALGLIRQDGLFVAVGLAGTLLLTAALAYALPLRRTRLARSSPTSAAPESRGLPRFQAAGRALYSTGHHG
jgi:hypothetical protein